MKGFLSETKSDNFSHVDSVAGKNEATWRETDVAPVTLSAAVEAQKPSLWSKNMLKLYCIMGVGYLVSTMNGFGWS